jgi:Fic family protein
LRTLGFDATNDIFAENAWYFRNALVRANYNDFKNGVHETTEFLELFLRNLLMDENHPLHNRSLHISGAFIEAEKADIETEKADIETKKADIGIAFHDKTTGYILKMKEAFQDRKIFGRSDVMAVIGIKTTRASELLKELAERGIIEPVTGHGKGKYQFKP